MAYYAALVSLVQSLEEIIHGDECKKFFLNKNQIASVHKKLSHLLASLEDYSPKDREAADFLERRIRDSAYEAQDIIETQMTRKGIYITRDPQPLSELEKVEEEVDSIVEEMMRIKMESLTTNEHNLHVIRHSASTQAPSIEASNVQAPSGRNTMVVFDEHLMTTIKGQLCGESSKLDVISIVGMGGLGKTTLARNIFDDKLIQDRFDCRSWVTVSQDYHLRNILLAIVDSFNTKKRELREAEVNVLAEHIYKHLFGRRYLIILDDMWDTQVWNDTKKIFPDNSNGSRIMITTRVSDVAIYAGCSSKFLHQMQFLNVEQSWTLLREKVFAQEHCPEELEVIGKLIAKNCRGLPLAIVVIAGVLSNVNKAQHDWESIARNISSTAIDQNDEHLSKILSLSYNKLPHHLKPCFLYFGGFPEDHEIPISKLIRLWVAEGFLKPIESKSLEEVGEEYFLDLVNRNLVLITKKTSNGKFKNCSIHDLLRDLCSQRAHHENFLHRLQEKDDVDRESTGNVRRLYIQTWDDSLFLKYITEHVSSVRSVISFARVLDEDHFLSIASGCKLLRILDTTDMPPVANFTKKLEDDSPFPDEILELLHLRYLTIRALETRIPPSIFKLQNLQTLIVHGAGISLPSEIWKMPQLRHLVVWNVKLHPIPYSEIRNSGGVPLLGMLQTLSKVVNFIFTRDTVEMIPNLKKLKVRCTYAELGKNWQEFGLKNLVHLHQLEALDICFSSFNWTKLATPLPESFAFPSNLIKLSLEGCSLPWKDMTAVGSLPNLQVLKLKSQSFVGDEWQPIEGEFLKLKFLLMEQLCDLKYLLAENTHFPCLEQLHIRFCENLEEIPPGIGDISTLQLIDVYEDKNSVVGSSALKIHEEQRDQGNDDLQVRVVSERKNPIDICGTLLSVSDITTQLESWIALSQEPFHPYHSPWSNADEFDGSS